jgi:hypothetical protein
VAGHVDEFAVGAGGALTPIGSLRTWLFTILVNRARTTGVREARSVPVADAGPAVDASRFGPSGTWAAPPEHWIEEAENRVDAVKLTELLRGGLDGLPARQREVVLLRFRSRPAELPCQEVVELVTDYLEGALAAADRRRFESHLAGCRHCAEYLAQIRETVRLAGRITPEDLPPEMSTDLMDLYRRWRAEG